MVEFLTHTFRKLFLAGLLIFLFSGAVVGQEQGIPSIRNYKSREYQASSANYVAVQDNRGLMYFGNYRGVLEYDGASWRLITVANHTGVRSLDVDGSGRIYVGALGEMGYLGPDSLGNLRYISLNAMVGGNFHLGFSNIIKVAALEQGAIFLPRENGLTFYWDGEKLQEASNRDVDGYIRNIFSINHEVWALSDLHGLMRWDGKRFVQLPGSEKINEHSVVSLISWDGNSFLARTFSEGFILISPGQGQVEITPFPTEADDWIREHMFSNMIPIEEGNFFVGTLKSGGVVVDHQGKAVRYINEDLGIQDNLILGAFQDKERSLWLALSRGISRVEIASPLSQWNEASGLKGLVFSIIRFRGTIYASTPLGVFYLENNTFKPVEGIGVESWKLMKVPGLYDEKLVVATIRGAFEIRNQKGYPLEKMNILNPYQSPFRPSRIYSISGTSGVKVLDYNNGSWNAYAEIEGLKGRYNSMAEDREGNLWLVDMLGQGKLYKVAFANKKSLKPSSVLRMDSIAGLPPVLAIYHFREDLIFSTSRGLYHFDHDARAFIQDTLLQLAPSAGNLVRFQEDFEGNVWVERQSGPKRWLEFVEKTGADQYRRDSTMLQGLANIEVWSEIFSEENGLTWIGTQEGLFVYNTRKKQSLKNKYPPLIREVAIAGDSVVFFGSVLGRIRDSVKSRMIRVINQRVPVFDYEDNSLSFQFCAPYFREEKNTRYSFFLKGWDNEWSPWTTEMKKDYTALPPGEYEFMVRARNIYDQESDAAVYAFSISPPWYRTIWAFISYGFLVLFLIYGTVKLNTQRLHLQNENLERVVYERTAEIWEQHKEIVKKTVALKRQKEEIAAQHDLVEEKNEALENTLRKLKETQSKLVDSEKMASLGQLTAGIAHEINNPINFVKGNINPLKRDFEEIKTLFALLRKMDMDGDLSRQLKEIKSYCEDIDAEFLFEEMEQLLGGIEEGAVRTKEIVDGLKIFARSDLNNFKSVDIHLGINATLTLLANSLRERIEIKKDFAELPMVECMPGKLNQVFMNIFTNAIQAIEARAKKEGKPLNTKSTLGTISIKTERIDICPDHPEGGVKIRIRDNGEGIPQEVKSRIFDPFFTTKGVGEGTGLGLSITFGIIENHKGKVEVESVVGEGTEFMITLPFKQPDRT